MIVEIDADSGFCNGVVRAIRMAEEELQDEQTLFSLGDIVHNEPEVARLRRCGMHSVSYCELSELAGKKLLIRAHGEPPETYNLAAAHDISIVDATCPVVLKLQKKIRGAYLEAQANEGQIVIYGKAGHAEVNGLVGQTDNTAIVIGSIDDLTHIDFSRPVYLFSQTTMTIDGLEQVRSAIEQRQPVAFRVNDSICRQVSNREPQLIEFVRRYDVVIFVSGRKSSNGKALYDVCLNANPRSRHISTPEDIDMKWFEGASSVGICGATSTPRWLMEEVANTIKDNF